MSRSVTVFVDNRRIDGGDFVSIDGWSGAVYAGRHEVEEEETYKISI